MLFGRELRLVHVRIRLHCSITTALRELKHAVIERVETGQPNELVCSPSTPMHVETLRSFRYPDARLSLLVLEQERIKIYNMPVFPEERKDAAGSKAFDECSV